jgi:DNA-binding CsgD family transcriptional regulator
VRLAELVLGHAEEAAGGSKQVGAVLSARAVPGTLPAIDHARGLILHARGDVAGAQPALAAAATAWQARHRFWEGTWARFDLAALALKSRRRVEATRLIVEVRSTSAAVSAIPLIQAADRPAGSSDRGRPVDPWFPLSAREFEVAQLVAAGLTNRQIAGQLVLAPKTILAHIEHILTKLGAPRRAEIAAWCAAVQRG